MTENPRLRFVATHPIDPSDLPLAAEVWLDDLKRQSWASAEAIKLCVLFVRYLGNPEQYSLNVGRIEGSCRIDAQQLSDELRRMQTFGFVNKYEINGDKMSLSLNLTLLQHLKMLETRESLGKMLAQPRAGQPLISPEEEAKWMLKSSVSPAGAADNKDVQSN